MSEVSEHLDHYYGCYRAIVISKEDPESRNRLRVKIPQVHGDDDSFWALPAMPSGAINLPNAGAGVWVMFEAGDPEHPVWIGVFAPASDQAPQWEYSGVGPPGVIVGAMPGQRYLDESTGNIYILS